MKCYKRFVENNRRLGQEASAFGNEALDGEQQRMKGKGWRDGEIRMQRLIKWEKKYKNEEMSECWRQIYRDRTERGNCLQQLVIIPHCCAKKKGVKVRKTKNRTD